MRLAVAVLLRRLDAEQVVAGHFHRQTVERNLRTGRDGEERAARLSRQAAEPFLAQVAIFAQRFGSPRVRRLAGRVVQQDHVEIHARVRRGLRQRARFALHVFKDEALRQQHQRLGALGFPQIVQQRHQRIERFVRS